MGTLDTIENDMFLGMVDIQNKTAEVDAFRQHFKAGVMNCFMLKMETGTFGLAERQTIEMPVEVIGKFDTFQRAFQFLENIVFVTGKKNNWRPVSDFIKHVTLQTDTGEFELIDDSDEVDNRPFYAVRVVLEAYVNLKTKDLLETTVEGFLHTTELELLEAI